MIDERTYGEDTQTPLRVALLDGNLTPRVFRVFASVDGGISFRFVGNLWEGKSFVAQPPFLRFDADDREAIRAAVGSHFPDLTFVEIKVPPVGLDGRHDDDPPPPEPKPERKLYIP